MKVSARDVFKGIFNRSHSHPRQCPNSLSNLQERSVFSQVDNWWDVLDPPTDPILSDEKHSTTCACAPEACNMFPNWHFLQLLSNMSAKHLVTDIWCSDKIKQSEDLSTGSAFTWASNHLSFWSLIFARFCSRELEAATSGVKVQWPSDPNRKRASSSLVASSQHCTSQSTSHHQAAMIRRCWAKWFWRGKDHLIPSHCDKHGHCITNSDYLRRKFQNKISLKGQSLRKMRRPIVFLWRGKMENYSWIWEQVTKT